MESSFKAVRRPESLGGPMRFRLTSLAPGFSKNIDCSGRRSISINGGNLISKSILYAQPVRAVYSNECAQGLLI
jgi:hypothetical protein